MADKTKMIVRNDPKKNRKSKCDGCGTEMEFDPTDYRPVADDMMEFITNQQHWVEHHSPSIAWGMLSAVFNVIFDIAPTEEQAVRLITDCMSAHIDGAYVEEPSA